MKILFLHPNFPGQFVRPALGMARQGEDVVFICQTHYDRQLPGVKRIKLKERTEGEGSISNNESKKIDSLQTANRYKIGMNELKSKGWNPDIIVSHSGFGCGLHSSCIWPKAYKVAYVEWWFANESKLSTYDPNNNWWTGPRDNEAIRERNLTLALELVESNILISPTNWQRNQLPLTLQERCKIIPDGVDLRRFSPSSEQRSVDPLLTYGTRGMEPMRGFPEFIEELPIILKEFPNLKVEIAGDDRICYGGKIPEEGSYGKWASKKLSEWVTSKRVKFIGRLNSPDYENWLKRTWFHVHLTRPFVASWSLLEAMASGCCMIASDTPPIQEFLNHDNALLIDHRKGGWLYDAVKYLLENPKEADSLRAAASVQSRKWNEVHSLQQWGRLLNSASQSLQIKN